MTTPLKIGIAGLGNVGASVFQLLEKNAALLSERAQRPLKVVAVSARTRGKKRDIDLSKVKWYDDPVAMADDKEIDVVVELMGGSTGPAFDLIKKAIVNGKEVVTANKALLALRGKEVLEFLKGTPGTVSYEAAVAGGIPVIKGLREGLAANRIHAVYGILNGTCNFILSEMTATGRDFADVLSEAQAKGYAEADPSFDIDGVDAGHKLSILAGIAFGCVPDFSSVQLRGIRDISALDIEFANELGYRIKLLGIARQTDRGVEQSVEPCLVPKTNAVAHVNGALNAVYLAGDYVGKVLMMGAGAGGNPTASAVVSDIIDVARNRTMALLGISSSKPGTLKPAKLSERKGSYFLRLIVLDQPGVIADVSAILRDCQVSLESVLQRGHAPGEPVPVILTSHETLEGNMMKAVTQIGKLRSIVKPPHLMRIEDFGGV